MNKPGPVFYSTATTLAAGLWCVVVMMFLS